MVRGLDDDDYGGNEIDQRYKIKSVGPENKKQDKQAKTLSSMAIAQYLLSSSRTHSLAWLKILQLKMISIDIQMTLVATVHIRGYFNSLQSFR